ncbi:hypothetical protein CAEBREN_22096 [Caenorhabditis brenneri]|uniref:USP domain-containing protein n=1 Tax=Caenorhabditis brenneri TaxID=135651 RepID=G0P4I2_CAEBE|nr:hypothetical protein CAEBREN_22096 [Caenorhabditis brenneri]
MKSEPKEKLDGDPLTKENGSALKNGCTSDVMNELERSESSSEKKTDPLEKYNRQQHKENSASADGDDTVFADPLTQYAWEQAKIRDLHKADIEALHEKVGILVKKSESIRIDEAPRQQVPCKEYSPRVVEGPSKQDNRTVQPQPFFKRIFGTTRASSESGSKQSKAQFESRETDIEISTVQKLLGVFGYSTLTPEDVFSPIMKRNQKNTMNTHSSNHNSSRQENSQPSLFKRIFSMRKSNGSVSGGNKPGENGVYSKEFTSAKLENNPTSTQLSSSRKSMESNGSSTTSGSSLLTAAIPELPFTDRSTQVYDPSTFYQIKWKEASDLQVATCSFHLSTNQVWVNYRNYPTTVQFYHDAVQFIRLYFPIELVDRMLECHTYHLDKPSMIFNAGLECYGIAAIHALFACKPLSRYLKDKKTESTFDHLLRVLYAMYKFDWDVITITPLLQNMGYRWLYQEDSEDFVRKFTELCFKDEFGKVSYQQTIACLHCSQVSVTFHENARISFERSDYKAQRHRNIQQLINEAASDSVIDRLCYYCRYNKSSQSLTYVLPTIISLHLNTLFKKHTGDNITFETEVDFAPMVKSQEPKLYKLGGVVYFTKLSEEMGHYFARVQYGNDSYIFDETKIKRNGRVTSGIPYYALYYQA